MYIYRGNKLLYYRHFGKALKSEVFDSLLQDLKHDAFSKSGNKVEYHDYYKYRISYISVKDSELLFLFVTGLTDNFDNIKKELIKCKKEFLNLFEDIIQHKYDAKTFEVFDPTIDSIHRNLRPKISLVGFSGVGKTTITRLIKAEEIPMQHIPTITGDIATIKIGKLHFHLWDFAGQEQFSYLWNNFIKGSDAVLLISDSSLENVEKSKFFLELIKEQAPNAHTAIIGNKQDLEESMKPEQIEKILGLKTYSMIAKNSDNRDKMIQIVADVLEMSAEVSPLLKPLLKRDTYIEEATQALKNAEFEKSATLFEKISDLCIELGDDSLGREFYEKSQKILSMLKKVSAPSAEPKVEEQPKEEKVIPQPEVEEKPVPSEKEDVKEKKEVPKVKTVKLPDVPPLPPKSTPKVQVQESNNKITPSKKAEPSTSDVPEKSISLIKATTFKKIDSAIEETNKIKKEVELKQAPEPVGLELNPEDFMVKPRPKTVTAVPKDAKQKLKTSPYAHVTNPEKPKTPVPINPVDLIKPKSFIPPKTQGIPSTKASPKTPKLSESELKTSPFSSKSSFKAPVPPPITSSPKLTPPKEMVSPKPEIKTPEVSISIDPKSKPSSISTEPKKEPETLTEAKLEAPVSEGAKDLLDSKQRAELEKSLMDLKVKKSNVTKMALDLDMKELTGEITPGELEEKKTKLEKIEKSINKQIQEINQMLN